VVFDRIGLLFVLFATKLSRLVFHSSEPWEVVVFAITGHLLSMVCKVCKEALI